MQKIKQKKRHAVRQAQVRLDKLTSRHAARRTIARAEQKLSAREATEERRQERLKAAKADTGA